MGYRRCLGLELTFGKCLVPTACETVSGTNGPKYVDKPRWFLAQEAYTAAFVRATHL